MSNKKPELDSEGEKSFKRPLKELNEEGEPFWQLGKKKRVTISQFKGTTYVNIRQYYEEDGKEKPGKKRISLTMEQWKELRKVEDEIQKQLEQFNEAKVCKKVKRG